ncbi:MAG: dihydrolipoamide acetyltransferase family protein [Hyphomicrobiaceae bacterium]
MGLFLMPSLGADMEAGKLVEWLVAPGSKVKRGDIVAVVETQKGAIEIEIFEPGTVVELLAAPDQVLPVGAPLARIRAPGEAEAEAGPAVAPAMPRARLPEAVPQGLVQAAPSRPVPALAVAQAAGRPKPSSPAARQRAAEAGLDLTTVEGSGPGGAVLLSDVERHLAAAPSRAAPARPPLPSKGKAGIDMVEMRKAIAAAMTRAKREIPHYYLSHEIDLQTAWDWVSTQNAVRPPDARLLMGALFVKATALALDKVPQLNGRHENGVFTAAEHVNAGLAISMRGGGLIAPAIMEADELSLDKVMDAMRDLVARTRAGRLRNSELTLGTITVSSMGDGGVDALLGVIYPPQVALIGFGTPRLRSMIVDGALAPRMAVTATLAADHRVSDGRHGATLLNEIDRRLQEPETL